MGVENLFYSDYHLNLIFINYCCFWLLCVLICYNVYHYRYSIYGILCVCICHYVIWYLLQVLIDQEHQIR